MFFIIFFLKHAKLIVWDELTMSHNHTVQAVDRYLKNLMNNKKLFGGKVVLFGGDFRYKDTHCRSMFEKQLLVAAHKSF